MCTGASAESGAQRLLVMLRRSPRLVRLGRPEEPPRRCGLLDAARGSARSGGPAAPLVMLAPPPARRALVPPALADGEPLQRQRRTARLLGGAEGSTEALGCWAVSSRHQGHPSCELGDKQSTARAAPHGQQALAHRELSCRSANAVAASWLPQSKQHCMDHKARRAELRRLCTGVPVPHRLIERPANMRKRSSPWGVEERQGARKAELLAHETRACARTSRASEGVSSGRSATRRPPLSCAAARLGSVAAWTAKG